MDGIGRITKCRNVLWARGRIVDSAVRPNRPVLWAMGLVGVVVMVDLVLSLGLHYGERQDDLTFNSDLQVRQYLAHAAKQPGPAWMLIGDSVLVGDSVRQEIPDWNRRRVVDYLRSEKRPDAPHQFYQVALNGLLPVDMVRIVRELDRYDPHGRIGLALEIDRRFFSPAYAQDGACTRAWIENLAPPLNESRHPDALAWARMEAQYLSDGLRRHFPVYRHRGLLSNPIGQWIETAARGSRKPVSEEALAVDIRMADHFRSAMLDDRSVQVGALKEILRRIRRAGRPAVWFTPPLNDAKMDLLTPARQYARDLSLLEALVAEEHVPTLSLFHFDHPMFDPTMFKDIVHLYPAGSRLLAVNLLMALNVPLAQSPDSAETVYPESPDATLLWNINSGENDGPAWTAAFRSPGGLAVDGEQRLIIADTGNHCLRSYVPSLHTVRTLAGRPDAAGVMDGFADEALLDTPNCPCILDDAVYFADESGRKLRRYASGMVFTEHPVDGPEWEAIQAIRARGPELYILDGRDRILAYHPRFWTVQTVAVRGEGACAFRAFDVSPDGRLFVADMENRLWEGVLGIPLRFPDDFRLLFGNTGADAVPTSGYFPFPFDQFRLENVADLRYVQRYDGLLVQDEFAEKRYVRGVDEREHFRFFGLADHLVYPWIKTTVSGEYATWNASAQVYVSPLRLGCIAFDQASGTLYHLERTRNRLVRLSDGLWAAAKTSQVGFPDAQRISPDLFGNYTGPYIFENRKPQRFLDQRVESQARKGPYIAVLIGPSYVSSTELSQNYSLARGIELGLQRQLGLCDGVRLDLVVRTEGGMSFYDAVNIFETFVLLDGRADIAIIALRNGLYGHSEQEVRTALEHLTAAALRYETQILFFNASSLMGMKRDGIRPQDTAYERTKEIVRAAGFPLLDPTNLFLRDSLEVTPFTCPPYLRHHATPWATDYAAAVFSGAMYPYCSAWLKDRAPARLRSDKFEEDPGMTLRSVFNAFSADLLAAESISVEPAAVQFRYENRHLDLFVDLNKVAAAGDSPSQETLDAIIFAVLYNKVFQDLAGRMAVSVRVALARFSNYDEYGAGLRESAKIIYQQTFDRDGLLQALCARFPGACAAPPADSQDRIESDGNHGKVNE